MLLINGKKMFPNFYKLLCSDLLTVNNSSPGGCPCSPFFEQISYNGWRKRHDNLLSILTDTVWQPPPPFRKILAKLLLTKLTPSIPYFLFFILFFWRRPYWESNVNVILIRQFLFHDLSHLHHCVAVAQTGLLCNSRNEKIGARKMFGATFLWIKQVK